MGVFQSVRDRDAIEPTLSEELAAFGDDDVVEMANLQQKHTGIPGVVFISTTMGAHGPRVKYVLRPERPSRASLFRFPIRRTRAKALSALRTTPPGASELRRRLHCPSCRRRLVSRFAHRKGLQVVPA